MDKEGIKKLARSGFGITSIVLHKLGYKLEDQAKLTKEQKLFLTEAFIYYKNQQLEETNQTSRKKNNMSEIKRRLKADGRNS